MADQKLTALTADGTPVATDLFYIVDDVGGTPTSKKISLTNLALGLGQTLASSSGPMSLDFAEDTDNGTNRVRVIAPASIASDKTLTLPDETGTLISSATLGVYTTYTPTIAQNGARTTSALAGRYCQMGKWVHAYGSATLSNAGTSGNAVLVSLPVAFASGTQQCGTGGVQRIAASTFYRALVASASGTQDIRFFRDAATDGNEVGVNPAFALASGNIITWNVTYEAA